MTTTAANPDGGPAQPPVDISARDRTPVAGWERTLLAAILAGTAALYLWGLSASGWANEYYSAAAQAGSVSWKAFLFGSSDAANWITIDKPPAALWPSALAVRLFGLSSWSILVPQALMGIATVAIVWWGIRRWGSPVAAPVGAAAVALTPVAVLMFRYNNPDALLTLLLTAAAVTTLLGIEDGRRRWMVATGALVGAGFLTKQLQALMVVPPFALAHLVAGPGHLRRRIVDLVVAGGTLVAAAGWWVALVEVWPASSRPYMGGSDNDSFLEVTFGYNGVNRLTGDSSAAGRWGDTGITRLVGEQLGGHIGWLLPVALVGLVAGWWTLRRRPRTDVARAGLLVCGGWLLVVGSTFSFMGGIFHPYYTVVLAPPIGALVAAGAALAWTSRRNRSARLATAATVAASTCWAAVLLGRAPTWRPGLAPTVAVIGIVGAVGVLFGWRRDGQPRRSSAAAIVAVATVLSGPAAWSLATAARPHGGVSLVAGPDLSDDDFVFDDAFDFVDPSDALVAALVEEMDGRRWIAAAVAAESAADIQLVTGRPVLAVGGFNGADPSPTLREFQRLVADGAIGWFYVTDEFRPAEHREPQAFAIATWVESNFPPVVIDGVTLYDLSGRGR